jgi:hypothetical protein
MPIMSLRGRFQSTSPKLGEIPPHDPVGVEQSPSRPEGTVAQDRFTRTPIVIGDPDTVNSSRSRKLMARDPRYDRTRPGVNRWPSGHETNPGYYTDPVKFRNYPDMTQIPPRIKDAVRQKLGSFQATDDLTDQLNRAGKEKGMIHMLHEPGDYPDPTNQGTSETLRHESAHALLRNVPSEYLPAVESGSYPSKYPSILGEMIRNRTGGSDRDMEAAGYMINRPNPKYVNPDPIERETYINDLLEGLDQVDKTGELGRRYRMMAR